MRNPAALLLIAAIGAWSATATPAKAFFFDYQEPQPPVAGDCQSLAARIGPDATWYGEYAGRYYDYQRDIIYPYSGRGCFANEFECRRWQNLSMTYTGRGGTVYTFCRRGAPAHH